MTEQHPPPPDPGVAVVGAPRPPAPAAPDPPPTGTSGSTGTTEETAGGSTAGPRRTPMVPSRMRTRARTMAPGVSGTPPWVVIALGAMALAATCLAIGFGVAWSDANSQTSTQATVKRVAGDFLLALTNFTPTSVDADFRTIAGYATGDFAKQSNQFFGSSIRQQLQAAQARSEGQLRYVYVQTLDGSQASVYAEVDQTYANNKVTTPITDVLQVVLGLTDTATGWKISAVTVLQPPASANAPTGNASSATGSGG